MSYYLKLHEDGFTIQWIDPTFPIYFMFADGRQTDQCQEGKHYTRHDEIMGIVLGMSPSLA